MTLGGATITNPHTYPHLPDTSHYHSRSGQVRGDTYTTLPPQPWHQWGGVPRGAEGTLVDHHLQQG